MSDEFAAAPVAKTAEVAEVMAQSRILQRRQAARAARMSREFHADVPFSMLGKVRCGLAIAMFLICAFVFMLGDSETYKTPINQLETEYQYVVSIGTCLLAALFLLPSFRSHKFLISSSAIFMVAMGCVMPMMWHAREPQEGTPTEVKDEADATSADEDASTQKGRFLTDSDLDVFRALCAEAPRNSHFAIFLTNQNSSTRTQVRESLTRLLQAEYTRAYTRANGALYVVANVRARRSNVARVAARYGQVVYANPDAGVYEVAYSAEKTNFVSRYSSEVLGSPQNPNFVGANVSELMCLDPMRVSAAAHTLASTNVQVLRRDIRDAIVQVLRDPWDSEPETYQALMEALVVYAPQGDNEAVQLLRSYFESNRAQRRGISLPVMRRLIMEDPDGMVEPVVQLWSANPIAWNEMIGALGSRAEEQLIAKVSLDTDLQLLDSVLKYLADYGTAKSIPAIEKLLSHSDSLVRHKAEKTINTLRARNSR
ncbi:MAG: hypothetical protein II295_06580 [Akkermansia sp.]|nr:hypothetical protein [Akkermansia sp.]